MAYNKEDFIVACERALHFYGGVPEAIVPDNLKSAVKKAGRYESELNDSFAAFAAQFTLLDPRLKIAGCNFDKLVQVPADEWIEIRFQLKGTELQQPEEFRFFHQGLHDQIKGARKCRLPIAGLCDTRQ